MWRVIVKTTTDTTANLEADRIEETDSFFKLYKENELVGAFDIGVVQFVYKTQIKDKG